MPIRRIINSPVFKRYSDYISNELLDEIKQQVFLELHLFSGRAFEIIDYTLNSEEMHTRYKLKAAFADIASFEGSIKNCSHTRYGVHRNCRDMLSLIPGIVEHHENH